MSRCGICKRIIWPWNRAKTIKRGVPLHRACANWAHGIILDEIARLRGAA